jgi:hypothetical protein
MATEIHVVTGLNIVSIINIFIIAIQVRNIQNAKVQKNTTVCTPLQGAPFRSCFYCLD